MNVQVFLKLYVLLYADDTLLFNETAKDMRNAVNGALSYCEKTMSINIGKTKYLICSWGKIRWYEAITACGQLIEGVDTFCYLWIVFRYNITSQAAKKHIIDKAKKALSKIEILLSRVDLQMKTRLHLFDHLILSILLYGMNFGLMRTRNKLKFLTELFWGGCWKYVKARPTVMVYGESGPHELKFTVWKGMMFFWKKLNKSNDKLSCIVFRWLNYKYEVWHLAMKQILINFGFPMAEEYASSVSDSGFNVKIEHFSHGRLCFKPTLCAITTVYMNIDLILNPFWKVC